MPCTQMRLANEDVQKSRGLHVEIKAERKTQHKAWGRTSLWAGGQPEEGCPLIERGKYFREG